MTETELIDWLHKVATRYKPLAEARGLEVGDLVNDAWIRAHKAMLKHNPDRGSVKTYLREIVEGAMKDAIYATGPRGYRRCKKGEAVRMVDIDDAAGVQQDQRIETDMQMREVNDVIIKILGRRERTILVKREMHEPLGPMSKKFKISKTRVVQIHRAAREKVRKILVKKG
jgi:RNA polymerase sigma factor (sigma-70 family)